MCKKFKELREALSPVVEFVELASENLDRCELCLTIMDNAGLTKGPLNKALLEFADLCCIAELVKDDDQG